MQLLQCSFNPLKLGRGNKPSERAYRSVGKNGIPPSLALLCVWFYINVCQN